MVTQYHVEAVERAIGRHTTPSRPGVHILFSVTENDFGLFQQSFSDEAEAEHELYKELANPDTWSEGIVDYELVTFYR